MSDISHVVITLGSVQFIYSSILLLFQVPSISHIFPCVITSRMCVSILWPSIYPLVQASIIPLWYFLHEPYNFKAEVLLDINLKCFVKTIDCFSQSSWFCPNCENFLCLRNPLMILRFCLSSSHHHYQLAEFSSFDWFSTDLLGENNYIDLGRKREDFTKTYVGKHLP